MRQLALSLDGAPPAEAMRREAVFSPCRTYRYGLSRVWDTGRPVCLFVMLNPSTADEEVEDPTVARCIGFARRWGYGALTVANLFALRSPDPKALAAHAAPVGEVDERGVNTNDFWLRELAHDADRVVAAWGAHPMAAPRGEAFMTVMGRLAIPVWCLGTTKDGAPRHPLYVPARQEPVPYG